MDCVAFIASVGVVASDFLLSSVGDPVSVIGTLWSAVSVWVADGYRQAPLIVVGLSALLIAPALALSGLVLRREPAMQRAKVADVTRPVASRNVWVAIEDDPEAQRAQVREMLRIGRQDDNDLCLANKTVHRYHALIYRSDDAQYMIMDLSGAAGNGIKVNGHAVAQSALTGGDRVELGEVRLRFETAYS